MLTWHTWTELYFLSEWLIRLFMLIYVPQRRTPAASRTWLLLIFIFPWPGLLVYAIFGRTYLPQRRIEMQEQASRFVREEGPRFRKRLHLHRPAVEPHFQQTVTLAENLGDFGIVGCNQVELLADYAGTINRLAADIDTAQHHVHLLYYIFADDETGQRSVADALALAVTRGVRCRVLIDSLGSHGSRRTLVPRLRAAGIDVHAMLPLGLFGRGVARFDLRNHRKIAVIDGRVGYVGSQNLVNADFKEGITYEELVARVTGPLVMQLQAVFLQDLLFETEKRSDEQELFPEPDQTGSSPAQALPSGPGFPRANTHRLMVALIHAAQKHVVLTSPYFIPDDAFLQALETAVLRGVEVHLVVSSKADQVMVSLAQRSYYEQLLEAGVKIHLYERNFLHAKHMSIDDSIVLIGSSNMDIRSFLLNAEISVLIYDPAVAAQLRAVQEQTLTHCRLLTLEEWQQRPLRTKVMQNMARLVDSLL